MERTAAAAASTGADAAWSLSERIANEPATKRRTPAAIAASSRFLVPSTRRPVRRLQVAGAARPGLRQCRQLMDDVRRSGIRDGRDQAVAIQGVGDGHRGTDVTQFSVASRRSAESRNLVT
jgi:hypothetical protein